jgi:phage terminase large subunit
MLFKELRNAGVRESDLITPDSAEPKSNEDLRRDGFRCVRPVKKRSGYKEDLVNRIRGFKIHLVAGDVDLQREFSTYSWSRDKNGKTLPKLQDGDDHYMDAFIMRMHDYYQNKAMRLSDVSAADLGL